MGGGGGFRGYFLTTDPVKLLLLRFLERFVTLNGEDTWFEKRIIAHAFPAPVFLFCFCLCFDLIICMTYAFTVYMKKRNATKESL